MSHPNSQNGWYSVRIKFFPKIKQQEFNNLRPRHTNSPQTSAFTWGKKWSCRGRKKKNDGAESTWGCSELPQTLPLLDLCSSHHYGYITSVCASLCLPLTPTQSTSCTICHTTLKVSLQCVGLLLCCWLFLSWSHWWIKPAASIYLSSLSFSQPLLQH